MGPDALVRGRLPLPVQETMCPSQQALSDGEILWVDVGLLVSWTRRVGKTAQSRSLSPCPVESTGIRL